MTRPSTTGDPVGGTGATVVGGGGGCVVVVVPPAGCVVGGGFIALVIKATGSYAVGLWVTALAFCVCAFFAFRLPKHIDSAAPLPRTGPRPPRPAFKLRVPPLSRIGTWASRGLAPTVITALRGESTMRFLSGFLAIFIAWECGRFVPLMTRIGGWGMLIHTISRPRRVVHRQVC